MASKDNTWKWGVIAAVFWLALLVLLIDIALGSFVAPSLVPQWKAQGLTSAPFPWQQVIDAADFSKMHWYVVFSLLLIGALGASCLTLGRGILQLWQARKPGP